MVRPSARSTIRLASSQRTSATRSSAILAEIFIPCLQQRRLVLGYELQCGIDLVLAKAGLVRKPGGGGCGIKYSVPLLVVSPYLPLPGDKGAEPRRSHLACPKPWETCVFVTSPRRRPGPQEV